MRSVALLPLPVVHALGVLFGKLLWYLPNRQRRTAETNLQLCLPELTPAERKHLVKQNLIETSKTMLEASSLLLWPGQRVLSKIRQVSGEEHWRQALQQGNGAIILTPHLGAWELSGLYMSQHYPMTALYRPSRLGEELDELIRNGRERLGGRYVPTDASGVRSLFQALRNKEVIGILPDQDPDNEGGVFAPFFGQPAYTMVLLSRLAMKYKVPVFLIYAERLFWGRGFNLHFNAVPAAIVEAPLEHSVAVLNQAIEAAIRELPEQYLWSYKRFKTRPEGLARVY